MLNRVLWTIDNEISGGRFERLCTDLLGREGFRDIVPIGGNYDRGRDAEIRRLKGIKSTGGITFFQYSLENDWRGKLERELIKVHKNNHEITFYVFVTSQRVTGDSRDKLAIFVKENYGWLLIIFDREWLRHRLEEAHPDLATKYLGIKETNTLEHLKPKLRLLRLHGSQQEKAWQYYLMENYERASIEFKELLERERANLQAWQALAWCQYVLYRYSEALVSINNALNLDQKNEHSLSIKACILTEDGIRRGIKANLLLARDIFKEIAKGSDHWIAFYNYGNVLHALQDFKGAEVQFLNAIDNNPQQPELWKNLGTIYYHLENHDKEIECYDKALEINNEFSQALLSKGITLLKIFNDSRSAIDLIKRGLNVDEAIGVNWPHAWYWLAFAYFEADDIQSSLESAEKGLSLVPHHYGLINLKAEILSKLWRENEEYIEAALEFYKFKFEIQENDFQSFVELARIFKAQNQSKMLHDLIENYTNNQLPENPIKYLEFTDHNFEEFLISLEYFATYLRFREISTIKVYIDLMCEREIICVDNFEEALFSVCSISFGLVCDLFSSIPIDNRSDNIEKAYSILFNSLGIAFPRMSTMLLGDGELGDLDQKINWLSYVLLTWPDIALVEVSRQIGFTGAIFGISAQELDKAVVGSGEKLSRWQKNIMQESLIALNKKLKLLEEE